MNPTEALYNNSPDHPDSILPHITTHPSSRSSTPVSNAAVSDGRVVVHQTLVLGLGRISVEVKV